LEGTINVFDGAGNQTESAAFDNIDYNGINQTEAITPVGQWAVPFGYAGTGQADRTLAGSTTAQNGSLGVQTEKIGSAVTSYVREPSGNLVYQKLSSGQTFYYYFDGLGTVIGQIDSGGNQRAKYTYDPFGAHATETGVNGTAPANPWRWMGGYLDAPTGLYHFGERYYDPARGRFLQVDPVSGGSANAYGYCSGDPINCSDLSGLYDWTWKNVMKTANEWSGYAAAAAFVITPFCGPFAGACLAFGGAARTVNLVSSGILIVHDCGKRTSDCRSSVANAAVGLAGRAIPSGFRKSIKMVGKSPAFDFGPGAELTKGVEVGTAGLGHAYDIVAGVTN
jgi:RHS repeat-associated protein